MKKLIFLVVVLPLLIISCRKEYEPAVAEFSVEYTGDAEVGEDIYFINTSKNAVSYEWNFGDGYGTDEAEPVYAYNSTGAYTITLTVTGEDGKTSSSSLDIEILVPTLLVVDIREWDTEDYVPGLSVYVFETESGWRSHEVNNALYAGYSDNNGIAVFSNLEDDDYFLDIWGDYHDNWDFINPIDGIKYIQTPEVVPHFINWFIAWVDVVDHTKSAVRGKPEVTIRKIERRLIAPHKAEIPDNPDWRELYEKEKINNK